MKIPAILFLCALIVADRCTAQVNELYSLGRSAAEGMSDKKREKLIKTSLQRAFIFSDSIDILRVPEDRVKGPAREHVIRVQRALEKAHGEYAKGRPVVVQHISEDLSMVSATDSKWDILPYRDELDHYEAYTAHLEEMERLRIVREQAIRDSAFAAQRMAEQRRQDSIVLAERLRYLALEHRQDSILKARHAQEVERSVAAPPPAASRPAPSVDTTPRSTGPTGGGRTYFTGPRGGCYYYSGSGKKVYVDHSYCR